MGIQGLAPELLKALGKTRRSGNLNSYNGKVLGMDASVFIMKALHSRDHGSEIARLLSVQPIQDITIHVHQYLDKLLTTLEKVSITPVFVLDGTHNPLKSGTNQSRTETTDKAKARLKSYWEDAGTPYDADLIQKLAKGAVCIYPEVYLMFQEWAIAKSIRIVCAPIEAEWQLISMEKQGVIDGIMSVDSDIMCLGGKLLITDFASNVEETKDKEIDIKCTVWTHDEVLLGFHKMVVGSKKWGWSDVRSFCILMGCDYFPRAASLSVLRDVFKQWVGASLARQQTLLQHVVMKIPLGDKLRQTLSESEAASINSFTHAWNQFACPTVFEIIAPDNMSAAKAFDDDVYTVALASFSVDNNDFAAEITMPGYDPRAVVYADLSADVNLTDVFRLHPWCRGGVELSTLKRPGPVDQDNKSLPHGSIIDFALCPVIKHQAATLLVWLAIWSPPRGKEGLDLDDDDNDLLEVLELQEKYKDVKVSDVISRAVEALSKAVDATAGADKNNLKARAVAITDINAFNELYRSRMDPGSATATKREQLLVHKRLHESYESGKLKKCMLSHYLKVMKPLREEMLSALDSNDMLFFSTNQIPKGLAKCPPGWLVLADRGFAFDAYRYPNLNRQITPHFINKRDQFTTAELTNDLSVCNLRYISETHFARVTDQTSLQDVVPHEYFPILQDVAHWAEGASNLCQPFYKPPGF